MRIIISILLTFIFLGLQSQTSYIQVVSEPGISVFLDGTFKGKTTTDIGGLILENVSPGNHNIKVLKEGYNPQEEKIFVESGEVLTYNVKPFIPKIKITQQGNMDQQQIDLKVGKIKIQSLPVSISISIPKLNINSTKTNDVWNADDIPVGNYVATFTWNNKSLRDTIEVKTNKSTHLFVNMIKREIEDRSTNKEEPSVNSKALYAGKGNGSVGTSKQDSVNPSGASGIGVSFNLNGRNPVHLHKPEFNIPRSGIVVVEITVDQSGKIISATPGVKGSTIVDNTLYAAAKKAALESKFNLKNDAPERQFGTITYHFKLL